MSSIQNDRDVAKISDALQKQHPRVHINELRRPSTTAPGRKGKGRGSGNKWKSGNGRGRYKSCSHSKKKAFHTVDTEHEEDEYDEDDPGDDDDPSAYLANPAYESDDEEEKSYLPPFSRTNMQGPSGKSPENGLFKAVKSIDNHKQAMI